MITTARLRRRKSAYPRGFLVVRAFFRTAAGTPNRWMDVGTNRSSRLLPDFVCVSELVRIRESSRLAPISIVFFTKPERVVQVYNVLPLHYYMLGEDSVMAQSKPPVFLLNPANLAFLQKKIKRPVLPGQKSVSLVIFFIVSIGSLIGFLVLAGPYWKNWYDLKNSGMETTGQMIDLKFDGNKKDSGFKVIYQFEAGNRIYQGSQSLYRKFYNSAYQSQNSLPIRYLPDNPEVSRLSGGYKDANENFTIMLSAIGAIWVLCWLIGLIVNYNTYDQNSRLLSQGKLVKGTVIACDWHQAVKQTSVAGSAGLGATGGMAGGILGAVMDDQINRRAKKMKYKLRLSYKFISPKSGREIKKTEKVFLPELSRQGLPTPGMPVAVLYRTDNHFRVL